MYYMLYNTLFNTLKFTHAHSRAKSVVTGLIMMSPQKNSKNVYK